MSYLVLVVMLILVWFVDIGVGEGCCVCIFIDFVMVNGCIFMVDVEFNFVVMFIVGVCIWLCSFIFVGDDV